MKLKLKVIPSSSKDCIMGWLDDALKIKVKAPPENGKANAAVEKFLAKSLRISAKDIKIITGFTAANKVIEFHEINESDVMKKIQHLLTVKT